MSNSLYALGRWAFRHHRRVIAAWMLVIVVAGAAAITLGGNTRDEFNIPGTESQTAIDALDRTFPQLSGASAYLVVVAPDGRRIDDARSRELVDDSIEQIKKVDGVSDVFSPYEGDVTDISISADHRAAQVQIQLTGGFTDITEKQKAAVQRTDDELKKAGYTSAFGGDMFTDTGSEVSLVELVGVIVAGVVLWLMYRSLRAAVMPVITALVGVIVTAALTFTAAGFITVSTSSPLLALMIGTAVGMDYALFIVSRHRELLASGVEPEESAARSVATAGSAVVFAGVTVVIALVGLAIARIPFLTVTGVNAGLSVVIAVAVALTLLPALLGRAGDRLAPKDGERPPGSFSRRWVAATTRFPLAAIATIVIILGVSTIPVKDLQLALPDNGTAPEGSTQRVAHELVEKEFGPGFNGPLMVTVDVISSRDPLGVVDDLDRDLRQIDGVRAIGLATPNEKADTAVVQVIPDTGPADQRTADLVHEIRDRAPAWEKEHGVDIAVTGLTAAGIDVSERLKDALLPFGLVVVGLSVLLLMVVFRSILVPIKATIGFILSTGAAFGAVVAVFQWGWFNTVLNVDQTGPLISFLPIMLMAVLFGLSMDYEVFLMSRMKEEYLRSDDPQRAIVDGFVGSSRVVTAAAVIMLAVFAAFVPDGDPDVKPIAFALAIGVFADAFLVRMLFAPAVLKLFGRSAWALPRRLGSWLPHVDVEGEGLHRQVRLASWPAPDSTEAVSASALTLAGTQGTVYNDVSISLPAGDRLVVHGPSGSGKSALLLTIAGRMPFDTGRLRVNGFLLPQETTAVRKSVALGETRGVNDLEDNLTVDQLIAERLSIRSFGLWVSRSRITPVRDRLNQAIEHAHDVAGLPSEPVPGTAHLSDLDPLARKLLGVVLALTENPRIVVIDDVDDLRASELVARFWSALDHLLDERDITVVASIQSIDSAPEPSDHLHLLELDTHRVLHELMI
ncbi:MMPL family transporter [Aeromicrobium sp.]|uniref:MMPL family transporter n=1 Tax=Aeromicrobium sp. TaxID=1871063 RepID=UPI003C642A54